MLAWDSGLPDDGAFTRAELDDHAALMKEDYSVALGANPPDSFRCMIDLSVRFGQLYRVKDKDAFVAVFSRSLPMTSTEFGRFIFAYAGGSDDPLTMACPKPCNMGIQWTREWIDRRAPEECTADLASFFSALKKLGIRHASLCEKE
jgi:hypothetical protein